MVKGWLSYENEGRAMPVALLEGLEQREPPETRGVSEVAKVQRVDLCSPGLKTRGVVRGNESGLWRDVVAHVCLMVEREDGRRERKEAT